ncbi:hypothetical protein GHT06_014416 [Daphnia sinensis]|uniref:Uncharacterized protein n=1 Tax=Daphnia sinensis TaxID=1820382 RepID=A0AAD5PXV7_9CRUS|nr:hypothetical protein GHT06_014416 [Daphnia sinensis]
MKILIVAALLMVMVSGQRLFRQDFFPNHDNFDFPTKLSQPDYREPIYRYNYAYRAPEDKPTKPHLMIVIKKLRKMLLV